HRNGTGPHRGRRPARAGATGRRDRNRPGPHDRGPRLVHVEAGQRARSDPSEAPPDVLGTRPSGRPERNRPEMRDERGARTVLSPLGRRGSRTGRGRAPGPFHVRQPRSWSGTKPESLAYVDLSGAGDLLLWVEQ